MTAATTTAPERRTFAVGDFVRDNAWTLGLIVFLLLLIGFTRLIQPSYGVSGIQNLAVSVLPLALAAVGQAIVVIAGGIDLSIASMMALTSVVAATQMKDQPTEVTVVVAIGVLALGLVLGLVNGGLVVVTRVPDIVVTLAMFGHRMFPGASAAARSWTRRSGRRVDPAAPPAYRREAVREPGSAPGAARAAAALRAIGTG